MSSISHLTVNLLMTPFRPPIPDLSLADIRSLRGMDIEKVVGSGTFGVVFKATIKETGERVALKKFKLEIDPQSQGFPMQVRNYCL